MAATHPPGASEDFEPYLRPTWFVQSDAGPIVAFAQAAAGDAPDEISRACRLFYAVRDRIRYSAYGVRLEPESFRAANVLAAGFGWCVTKSCLLAAAARALGIPCRLGYADVRNHLATRKLLDLMGTDVFYYHGYNELFLDGRWVKATVAFNESLCQKARLCPLEFDGRHDSLYHPFDLEGRRHMEYLHDYGHFADVPHAAIVARFRQMYPIMGVFADSAAMDATPADIGAAGDFEREIEAEARAAQKKPSDG